MNFKQTTIPHIPLEDLPGPFFPAYCTRCDKEVMIAKAEEFREVYTGKMLAYYGKPSSPSNKSTFVGVSEGSLKTFECLNCHSRRWLERARRTPNPPREEA